MGGAPAISARLQVFGLAGRQTSWQFPRFSPPSTPRRPPFLCTSFADGELSRSVLRNPMSFCSAYMKFSYRWPIQRQKVFVRHRSERIAIKLHNITAIFCRHSLAIPLKKAVCISQRRPGYPEFLRTDANNYDCGVHIKNCCSISEPRIRLGS